MARENQGLQACLIISVFLVVVLIVTTILGFRQASDASQGYEVAKQEQTEAEEATQRALTESNELKRMIGFSPSETMPKVSERYKGEMLTWGADVTEENQNYRFLLTNMHRVVTEKDAALTDANNKLNDCNQRIEQLRVTTDLEVAKFKTAAEKAQADLQAERTKYGDDRNRLITQDNELKATLQKVRKAGEEAVIAIQAKFDEANKKLTDALALLGNSQKKLRGVQQQTFEVADGEIRLVTQRNGTVWITLGRADGLPRQASFSVYPADADDVSRSGSKGKIEVTEILGEHLSEGRILEDELSNPIMPGDKIHTPFWAPGQQRHFALAGSFDIDDDGTDDVQKLRHLIELNGGAIDAIAGEEGKMTIQTRYLVLGKDPDETATKEELDAFSAMVGEADRLRVEKILIADLLQNMGWKNQTPVVRYGRGRDPDQFKPLPPAGGQKVSTGNVSPLYEKDFKSRRPPSRSAY